MKNRLLIILLFLTTTIELFPQNFLEAYLDSAARNNPGLRAKFNNYNAALQKIPQVGSIPDPSVSFGYFIMPVETRNGPQTAKISVSQMFPWFGTPGSKEDVMISKAKAEYEDFEEAKSQLYYEVRSKYFNLYFIKKEIGITRENIKILKTFKRLATIKAETGTSSGTDKLRIEMELNELQNHLLMLTDRWRVKSLEFNNLLNTGKNSPIKIPDVLPVFNITLTRQAIADSIAGNNHSLRSLDFMKESAVNSKISAEKLGFPAMSVGVDYIPIGNSAAVVESGKDALMVKIGVSIPLYRKKYSAMVKESAIRGSIIDDKKYDRINNIENLLEKAWASYDDANRRLILYSKQKTLAARAIKLLETEYANNGSNFEEILRMERRLLNYSVELERAGVDKQNAVAFIYYLMGL